MLSENLRGEMTVVPIGAQITLKDSKFIQEIAKYLYVSCKEVPVQVVFAKAGNPFQ